MTTDRKDQPMSRYGNDGPCTLAEAQDDDEQRTQRDGDAPESLRDTEAFCSSKDPHAAILAAHDSERRRALAERDEARAWRKAVCDVWGYDDTPEDWDEVLACMPGWKWADSPAEVAELRAKVARVEALADEWRADWPGPGAAWSGTPDEWWRDLRAALADPAPVAPARHDDTQDGAR